jgi:hypothetical protein
LSLTKLGAQLQHQWVACWTLRLQMVRLLIQVRVTPLNFWAEWVGLSHLKCGSKWILHYIILL